jgi:hypothetical protein
VPQLNFRLSTPTVIVDPNRIPQLSYIRHEDGQLCFDAMARQRQVQFSELVAQKISTDGRGNPLYRTFADPHAWYDWREPRTCRSRRGISNAGHSAYGEMVVHGPSGERAFKPFDFFRGP